MQIMKNNLIAQLKNEHIQIVEVLNKVMKLGVDNPESKAELKKAKDLFLNHINNEDTQLYPELKKLAVNNQTIAQTMKLFGENMEKISAQVLDFFSKYENDSDNLEFTEDFKRLYVSLSQRIKKEEIVLYRFIENPD